MSKVNFKIAILVAMIVCSMTNLRNANANPGHVFVAPGGDDNNQGAINSPLKTITKALTLVLPGDTILLRGGIYLPEGVTKIDISGTEGKMIYIMAFKGEKPVFDCSSYKKGGGMSVSGNYIYLKGFSIMNTFAGFENVPNSGTSGLSISGSHNIIEQCNFFRNGNTGLQLGNGASNNHIINCDSYLNFDACEHGEDADGFGAKFNIGTGNVYSGCRSFNNGDDGWDLWRSNNSIRFENCWAFDNGVNVWVDKAFQGNGNGFKLGGGNNVAPHILIRCLSFYNEYNGFDQNGNIGAHTLLNCTAFHNGGNNYRFNVAPAEGNHVMKNNISYSGWKPGEKKPYDMWGRIVVPGENDIVSGTIQVTNSWNGFSFSAADFISSDSTGVRGPRKSDGSLPDLPFLKLAGSSLINGGTDIGYPYNGTAPDLGAYETFEKTRAVAQTVKDIDGNVYKTVTIGKQVWMTENLKTTKLNDGTPLPQVQDNAAWKALTTPAYCWFKNDAPANKNMFGALYIWYTVNTGKLCPSGWHVPSDADFTALSIFLGGDGAAGAKLKEKGTNKWVSPNAGATNESGFTALPCGGRGFDGIFGNSGGYGSWWTSTEFDATDAWARYLECSDPLVHRGNGNKHFGFTVRCLQD
jgi:uncharacterized protein (TIGR02145 family)